MLKGPEIPASDGSLFRDKEGTCRDALRTCWWDLREGLTISDLAMPPGWMMDRRKVDPDLLRAIPDYRPDATPVFFRRYWLPATEAKAPRAPNIACLDFSAGLEGDLVAYRWA